MRVSYHRLSGRSRSLFIAILATILNFPGGAANADLYNETEFDTVTIERRNELVRGPDLKVRPHSERYLVLNDRRYLIEKYIPSYGGIAICRLHSDKEGRLPPGGCWNR